jgi:GTP-binding protein LepA
MRELYLDNLLVERRHGITVKSRTIRISYNTDGEEYSLCLLDTPGHVDFSVEVSNCVRVVEGAILLVDATQGIQAQTLANIELASQLNIKLIPAINKVDRTNANIAEVSEQIESVLSVERDEIFKISARDGTGVPELLKAIVQRISPPTIPETEFAKYIIVFDSFFKAELGSIIHIRIYKGTVRKNDELYVASSDTYIKVLALGLIEDEYRPVDQLDDGQIGYIVIKQKFLNSVRAGFLVVDKKQDGPIKLPQLEEIRPMLVCTLYPKSPEELAALEKALASLAFNDIALTVRKEYSDYLGMGLRCGFLGSLHLTITIERLKDEFNLDVLSSLPSVTYRVRRKDMSEIEVSRAYEVPDDFKEIAEPMAEMTLLTPVQYNTKVIELIRTHRGDVSSIELLGEQSYKMKATIPIMEIIVAFNEELKTVSNGYASFRYVPTDYRVSSLTKLTVLINNREIKALCCVVPSKEAYKRATHVVQRLEQDLSKRQYDLVIQVAANKRIIARGTVKRYRKDVTQKLYGGDISRKMKLLEKQKKGKKKMSTQERDIVVSTETVMGILRFERNK